MIFLGFCVTANPALSAKLLRGGFFRLFGGLAVAGPGPSAACRAGRGGHGRIAGLREAGTRGHGVGSDIFSGCGNAAHAGKGSTVNPDCSKVVVSARRWWAAVSMAMVLALLLPGTASAQLSQRYQTNINGNVQMVGNGLLTCTVTGSGSNNPNANCAAHQGGTGTNGHNGGRTMQYIHVDSTGLPSAAPANSSTAQLSMPAGC